MSWKFDYLVVGAGFSGLVIAERLATQSGKSCLVVDRRAHVGGNAYDDYDKSGVLIHKYGPHYFRTNSPRIRDYLSQFTEWIPAEYRILSHTEGQYWSFPVNLKTYEQLVGRAATEQEFAAYLENSRVPIEKPGNSEEVIVSQVGWELYDKFFKNYTIKQWRRHPRDLDASVCGRIPVRTNRDDRYFNDSFQALPAQGYTKMFERMIKSSPKIKVLLQADFREVMPHIEYDHMVYTGPIDEYYDYCFEPLPYRSLRFEEQSFSPDELKTVSASHVKAGFWQPAVQVNYPNDSEFTRIVEAKHITKQRCEATTIVREYPDDFRPGKEPYYPIPAADAQRQYALYKARADQEQNVSFIGRLATYRYYNMDQVVGMALSEYDRLSGIKGR